jgi:hypothetical protein
LLIERIHELVHHTADSVGEVEAHKAVIELLVLTVYADDRISTDELEALERFDDEHSDWDAGPFSVQQYLPVAVAKVRNAIAESGGADALIADAASRIHDPSMRSGSERV